MSLSDLMPKAIDPTLCALLYTCSRAPDDKTAFLVAADCAQEQNEKALEWLLRFFATEPEPFLFTGSRRYGAPRPNSDFDWVWRRTAAQWELWQNSLEQSGIVSNFSEYDTSRLTGAYRYGPVNLILVDTHDKIDKWRRGTELLAARVPLFGPNTREEAIKTFDEVFNPKFSGYEIPPSLSVPTGIH